MILSTPRMVPDSVPNLVSDSAPNLVPEQNHDMNTRTVPMVVIIGRYNVVMKCCSDSASYACY